MAQYKPRTEFAVALSQIASERGIEVDVVLETIKAAILAAYRRDARERGVEVSEDENFDVEIGPESGEARVFSGEGKKKEDITPPGFSRIATQTAKQVILQKIREAEKTAVLLEYSKRAGTLVSGMILRFEGPNTIVDIGKTEAVMPPQEQVKNENNRPNQRLTFYLVGVEEGPRGEQVIVSRSAKELVEGLFKREVPEVSSGAVQIKNITREAGVRTKIAVVSTRPGIDPVGSCVGQKGVRVTEIINELFGEKIDIIQYNEDASHFIAAALSPAEKLKIELDEEAKVARVTVPEDQLSLAIGKDGQNVRLASNLTGYKIDILGGEEKGKGKEKVKEGGKTEEEGEDEDKNKDKKVEKEKRKTVKKKAKKTAKITKKTTKKVK